MGVVCGGTTYKKGIPLMVLLSIYTIYTHNILQGSEVARFLDLSTLL